MGKLTIRGKASMNCTYDIVTLEIEFYRDGNTANAAMDAVLNSANPSYPIWTAKVSL